MQSIEITGWMKERVSENIQRLNTEELKLIVTNLEILEKVLEQFDILLGEDR